MKIFTNLRKEHFNLHIHGIFTKAQYTTIFQSTHPHRIQPKLFVTASKPFQSTHPCRMQRKGQCVHQALWYFNPRIHTKCNGNNINDFRIPIYNVQFLNQSLTQFRVCFMSYLGDFGCEPLKEFLWALTSHRGGVEPPTFVILILYTKFIYLSRYY